MIGVDDMSICVRGVPPTGIRIRPERAVRRFGGTVTLPRRQRRFIAIMNGKLMLVYWGVGNER